MRLVGVSLWLAGVALAGYAAFIFDTTLTYPFGTIVNLDLQQRQMMMLVAAGALFIVGVLLHALTHTKVAAPQPKKRKPSKPPMPDFSKIDA